MRGQNGTFSRYDHGALHHFLITYEMARQGVRGEASDRSRKHFERAVQLSDGHLASPWVSLAESVCVQKQDRTEFLALLAKALAVPVDAHPAWRLQNLVAQGRARWLQGRVDDLFLGGTTETSPARPESPSTGKPGRKPQGE